MKVVIFDCDGVLVDSEALAEQTLEMHLREWLPDLDIPTLLSQALGMTTASIIGHLAPLSAHTLPPNAAEQADIAIEARLAQELRAIDGVKNAISAIDLPKAVVSNSRRRRVEASLECTQLSGLLDNVPIFTAEQVTNPKPDPAVYQLAAASLGCEPQRCLVVEDSVAGVTAAHAAGMSVIGFVGGSHVDDQQPSRLIKAGAWRILPHMEGLSGLVEEWQADLLIKP